MAATQQYKVVGTQRVRKPGTKVYAEPGETFSAKPEEVKFLVDVGAVAQVAGGSAKTAKRAKK